MVVVKSYLKGSGFPAVLARAGPALRPDGGQAHQGQSEFEAGTGPAIAGLDEVEASVLRRARYTEERVFRGLVPR